MRKWYPWVVVGLTVGFSAAMYPRLPESIPTHWDLRGNVDDYTSRDWAAWLMPAILSVVAFVMPRLPALDPRRANYDKFRGSYDLVVNAIVTIIALLHVAMLGVGAGWPIAMGRVTPLLIGALFVVIGNVMPRARPNWLFGIRTPWTLTNDRVWERTHRLGGVLFVIAGLLLGVAAFVMPASAIPIVIGGVIIAAIVPVVYSYFAWRQETTRVRTP
jgi:uncharacterized membrane protein